MAASVVDRLVDAINTHDIEALMKCFAPSFSMVWPAHPARSFDGPDRVRSNWEAIFQAQPDVQAAVTARVQNGGEIWGEWEFKGVDQDGRLFWQRGVVIVVVDGDVIVQSRFYMEPVEEAGN